MPGLLPEVDPDGLLEYSVVYTDRALNHMSARFQDVMNDVSAMLREATSGGADMSQLFDNVFPLNDLLRKLETCGKPVAVAIEGTAMGGGLELALACDLRIAGADALFALPPARLGLAYPVDGLRDLLHAVSPAFAKEMLFTARRYKAEEALKAGLVHRVTPQDRLEAETRALAAEIAENAPLTIKASKRAIDALAGRPVEEDLKTLAAACFASADYAEGQRAFLEKRKPRFTGT